jgi:hypothetical protein
LADAANSEASGNRAVQGDATGPSDAGSTGQYRAASASADAGAPASTLRF